MKTSFMMNNIIEYPLITMADSMSKNGLLNMNHCQQRFA